MKEQNSQRILLHPTVFSVLNFLFHLPAIRYAVWECVSIPETSEASQKLTTEDLLPHKFVCVIQQLFLKIFRKEPFSSADRQWSIKVSEITGNACFEFCRNYMLSLLIDAIPGLEDLLKYSCEHTNVFPEVSAAEARPLENTPFTFGSPAHDMVEKEISEAAMLGFRGNHIMELTNSIPQEILIKFRSINRKVGDGALCQALPRYDRYSFPPVLIFDRWISHPCVPDSSVSSESEKANNSRCEPTFRISPHAQFRPPDNLDMAPLFPWAREVDAQFPLEYCLFSVSVLRGYEWADLSDGSVLPGNVPTSLGVYTTFVNENMSGDWFAIEDGSFIPITVLKLNGILQHKQTAVVSYVFVSAEQTPILFPPPSSVQVPLTLQRQKCGLVECGALAEDSALFSVCSKCKVMSYCSTACSKQNWKKHRLVCSNTSELADVFIPDEPPKLVRQPLGEDCKVCLPIKAQEKFNHLLSLPREHLRQNAMHMFPSKKSLISSLSKTRLARILSGLETLSNPKKVKSEEICNDGEEEEDDDEGEDDVVSDHECEHQLPSFRRRDRPKGTLIGRWALPVILIFVGILMAISWSSY